MRVLHGAVADDAAERREHQRRLLIGGESVVAGARVVGVPHHRRLGLGATGTTVALAESIQHRRLGSGVGIGENVHVLIEALVHPTVPRFVVAHDHGPPHMSRFVVGRARVRVDHHRIFHTGTRPVLQRELRELIREPELRIELECVTADLTRLGEQIGTTGQEQHVHRDRALAGNRGPGRVPHVLLGGGPGKIVDRVGVKTPHESSVGIAHSGGLPRTDFIGTDDRGDGVGLRDFGEAFAGGRGEHLLGVLQHTGAAHDPSGRDVDVHVERAEVVVKLRRADIELVVPAAQVVVHGHARVPLRGLIERIRPSLHHAVSGAWSAGKLVRPGDLEHRLRAGRDRRPESHAGRRGPSVAQYGFAGGRVGSVLLCGHDRARARSAIAGGSRVGGQINWLAIDGHARNDHAIGHLGRDPWGGVRRVPEEVIRIEAKADVAQRIGAAVMQRDTRRAGQTRRGRVERYIDRIVGAQLPVVAPRAPGGIPRARRVGATDTVRDRHIAPDGARRCRGGGGGGGHLRLQRAGCRGRQREQRGRDERAVANDEKRRHRQRGRGAMEQRPLCVAPRSG